MGLNISGLVIDKNYQNDLGTLEQLLGRSFLLEGEVPFEEATSIYRDDAYCDAYFSDRGTLLFLASEYGSDMYLVSGQRTLAFVLHEVSESYSLQYSEDGAPRRAILSVEDKLLLSEGEPLRYEIALRGELAEPCNQGEVLKMLLQEFAGLPIESLEMLERSCLRYRLAPLGLRVEPKPKKKPWWKFW